MFPILETIQWIYTIPSLILYTIFTIRLGINIILKNDTKFKNTFFILIFFKGCSDITVLFTIILFTRITIIPQVRFFFMNNFYLLNIFHFFCTACYTLMFEIMFIISFTRTISICKPTKYDIWVSNKNLYLYITISIIIALIIGSVSATYQSEYVLNSQENRLLPLYVDQNSSYFIVGYTLGLYLPLLILSFLLNSMTINQLRLKKISTTTESKADANLQLFAISSFLIFLVFGIIYILRALAFLTKVQIMGFISLQFTSYVIDAATLGLFYLCCVTRYFNAFLFFNSKLFLVHNLEIYAFSKSNYKV